MSLYSTRNIYPHKYDELDYNPDYYIDTEYDASEQYSQIHEDLARIEEILFNDTIDEEELQRRAEESGVYNCTSDELLEFITAAELKKEKGES